jgi:hypothetical protein
LRQGRKISKDLLVCDEVQIVKNMREKLHEAVKALHYASIILLSGTVFHNLRQDVFGALDLFKKEPFDGCQDLARLFCDPFNKTAEELPPSRFNRLCVYLLSCIIGRPRAVLDLKLMKCWSYLCLHRNLRSSMNASSKSP